MDLRKAWKNFLAYRLITERQEVVRVLQASRFCSLFVFVVLSGCSDFHADTIVPEAEDRHLRRQLIAFAAEEFGVDLLADSDLAPTAGEHSLVISSGIDLDSHTFLRQALSSRGIIDPFPYVFHGSSRRKDLGKIEKRLFEHLSQIPPSEARLYSHFGIGWCRRQESFGWSKSEEWFVTVLLTQRALAIKPIPRQLKPGDRFTFEGEIHAPFHSPKILLTSNDGTTEVLQNFSQQPNSFRTHVSLGPNPGEYQLEVLGRYDMGPRVLGLCTLYTLEEHQVLMYTQLIDGARAGTLQPSNFLRERRPPTTERDAEIELLQAVNRDRRRAGLEAFSEHGELSSVARAHSRDMRDHSFFGHVSPNTGRLSDRAMLAQIRYSRLGENIAVGENVVESQRALMRSPGHRMNLLNPEFSLIGLGVVFDTDSQGQRKVFVTQNFLRPPGP